MKKSRFFTNFISISRKGNPSTMGLGLPLSASHSMLDQLSKKKDMPTTKSRLFLDAMAQQHANTNEQRIVLETLSSDGLFEVHNLHSLRKCRIMLLLMNELCGIIENFNKILYFLTAIVPQLVCFLLW